MRGLLDRVHLWASVMALLAYFSGCSSAADENLAQGADESAGATGTGGGSVASDAGRTGGGAGTGGAKATGGGAGTGGAKATGGSTGTGGAAETGGASGTGGATGTGGTHTVGQCNGLAAAGQWENITPPGITLQAPYKGTIATLLDPQNSGTLYSTTYASGILKSTDCGASWKKVNTGRNGDKLDAGSVWSAAIDPVDPRTLYALSGYGANGLWKSTNGGVDWDDVLTPGLGMPGFVARVALDPTNHNHVFINFHDNCTGGHNPVCFGESTDGGTTWKVIDFPTQIKNGWGEGTFLLPIDATHWLYENWEIYYTSDAGRSWGPAFGSAVQGGYFQIGTDYFVPSGYGVLKSTNAGVSWSQIANSGYALDAIMGDGSRLFALRGFQPPDNANFIWSAPYDHIDQWSALARPGSPDTFSAGGTDLAYDADHHLLYIAAQAAGLWRTVTQ
jgi:hypothetical protein